MSNENDRKRLRALFFDFSIKRQQIAERVGQRFVYYTSADTALKILDNGEIWMRSASVMNDASEIRYGMHCLDVALRGGGDHRLIDVLDAAHAGLVSETINQVRQAASAMFYGSYLTCVSEHKGGREDRLGRLSMWRAYGGSSGVALVFHGKAMHGESNALGAYTSPVVYTEPEEFTTLFDRACDLLGASKEFIAGQHREDVAIDLYEMLHFAVLSTKHPAFEEEAEWRIIHAPYHEASARLKPATETIRGVPQIVYKLPLQNVPEDGLNGLDLAESLDRIIIGPSNNPIELSFVFHEALLRRGVTNPYDKIVISNVPLRVPS
jgi:hypothetical protein